MLLHEPFFPLPLGLFLPPSYLDLKLVIMLMRTTRRQICHSGCDKDDKEDLLWKGLELLGSSTGGRGEARY